MSAFVLFPTHRVEGPNSPSWPDAFFQNVCELDLVFNFYKVREMLLKDELHCRDNNNWFLQVYAILDEVFLAGEIEETSKEVVLNRLDQLEKLE